MRVALYAAAFPPAVGGIERFSEVLADWLVGEGHEVVVVTPTPADPGYDRSRPYPVRRRPSFAEMRRTARWADAVHVKSLSSRAIAAAALAGRGAVVTHAHHQAVCPDQTAWSPAGACTAGAERIGPCSACPRQGISARVDVRSLRLAALAARRNVCISDYLRARLGLPRSVTVFNPVDGRAFGTSAEAMPEGGLVAFAGRLSPPKGVDLLLRALAQVPSARLEIAGDGAIRGSLQDLADSLGLAGRVRFLGALPFEAVAELYCRASVVCVPSTWQEPFGYSAAEAMAMGCTVVATPSGALPEILADGRGYVAAEPSPAALARSLRSALDDPTGCRAAGLRARRFAHENFRLGVIGPRYVDLYGS